MPTFPNNRSIETIYLQQSLRPVQSRGEAERNRREGNCVRSAQEIQRPLCRILPALQSRRREVKFSCNFRIAVFVAAADFGAIRTAEAISGYRGDCAPVSLTAAMSIFWAGGRPSALAPTRGPSANASGERRPRQSFRMRQIRMMFVAAAMAQSTLSSTGRAHTRSAAPRKCGSPKR